MAFEEDNAGVEIDVIDEIGGNLPSSESKLHALCTAPENSWVAAKELQALRFVLKIISGHGLGMIDPWCVRWFEITFKLTSRASEPLEARLLKSFLETHNSCGIYDFTNDGASGRNGVIDCYDLRDLTEELLHFDDGRN